VQRFKTKWLDQMKKLTVICLLSSILVLSCARDSDCPYVKDSLKPVSNMTLCHEIKSLRKTGTISRVSVSAGDFETHVGLTVIQHEEYKVIVPPDQVWYDCTRRNLPLCGEEGSFGMNLPFFKKRQKDALWFSVIAKVKTDDKKSTYYDLCKLADSSSKKTAKFEVENCGELIMYPNDDEDYYDNNRGKIWLEIQRLK
jgi:hypothetical protein